MSWKVSTPRLVTKAAKMFLKNPLSQGNAQGHAKPYGMKSSTFSTTKALFLVLIPQVEKSSRSMARFRLPSSLEKKVITSMIIRYKENTMRPAIGKASFPFRSLLAFIAFRISPMTAPAITP